MGRRFCRGPATDIFGDEAVRKLFHASAGTPRRINQLALQVPITAAGAGIDTISGDFMRSRGHETFLAPNGAIEIRESTTDKVVFAKARADGKAVWS